MDKVKSNNLIMQKIQQSRTFGIKWRFWKRKWKLDKKLGTVFIAVICLLSSLVSKVNCGPLLGSSSVITTSQTECDWTGRGGISTSTRTHNGQELVQTISLRCSSGSILWTDPKGGLKITLQPNLKGPYRLCLDRGHKMKAARVLLQQGLRSSLLPILTNSRTKCYQIESETSESNSNPATLYIETRSSSSSRTRDQNRIQLGQDTISLSYEVESIRGDGDDGCRPCSDSEVLKTYCTADAVVKGSIVQIKPAKYYPGTSPDNYYDSLYIKSNLVMHQTQPLFSHYDLMSTFLQSKPHLYNLNQPQKLATRQGDFYGGIVQHPSSCSTGIGDGEQLLWLIKFRFGRPITDCVLYWDHWVRIASSNNVECPVTFDSSS